MGRQAEVSVSTGDAADAYTGGMLADGADAVIMVENTQRVDAKTIEVVRPVAVGENVVQPGEAIKRGEVILPAGHYLRPQDLGGLTAMVRTSSGLAARSSSQLHLAPTGGLSDRSTWPLMRRWASNWKESRRLWSVRAN